MFLILFYGNIFMMNFLKFSSESVLLRNKGYSKLQRPSVLEISQ